MVLLSGCVNGLEIPADAVQLQPENWPADCGKPYLARVPTEEFESHTVSKLPSCSRHPFPVMWGACTNGVTLGTLDFAHRHSSIIYLDESMHMNAAMERDVLDHELRHALSICVSDDAQTQHDGGIWHDDVYVNAVKARTIPSDWGRLP